MLLPFEPQQKHHLPPQPKALCFQGHGAAVPEQGPGEQGCRTRAALECPSQEGTQTCFTCGQGIHRSICTISAGERLWRLQSTKMLGLHDLKPVLKPEKSLSSGKHDFGEEMQVGDATGETPMDCLAKNRLSRGSTFPKHPISHTTAAQLGGVLQTGFFLLFCL